MQQRFLALKTENFTKLIRCNSQDNSWTLEDSLWWSNIHRNNCKTYAVGIERLAQNKVTPGGMFHLSISDWFKDKGMVFTCFYNTLFISSLPTENSTLRHLLFSYWRADGVTLINGVDLPLGSIWTMHDQSDLMYAQEHKHHMQIFILSPQQFWILLV